MPLLSPNSTDDSWNCQSCEFHQYSGLNIVNLESTKLLWTKQTPSNPRYAVADSNYFPGTFGSVRQTFSGERASRVGISNALRNSRQLSGTARRDAQQFNVVRVSEAEYDAAIFLRRAIPTCKGYAFAVNGSKKI